MVARTRTDGFVEPCILSCQAPDWVHEIKHDGCRLIVRRDGKAVRLFTRRGHDWHACRFGLEGIVSKRLSAPYGQHSVGVARQYCGQFGKQDNCQVAVSLSLANHHASLPVAYRLYLPDDWAGDSKRRRKTGVPEEISFKTKPEIALEQIAAACEAGLPRGVVLMDAGYGCNTNLRTGVSALALRYVAGILSQTSVWASGTGPLPPKKWSGRGGVPKLMRRDRKHQPISVKELALGLPKRAWRSIKWWEGTAEWLSSRFARVRVRAAHHDYKLTDSRPEEWLLIEWPEGEKEPTKYWLSTVPKDITFRQLVNIAKLRWRIERDYQDLKQEVGLGHFEGRGWRGFHHHASLCIAAYGFLVSERETIPPSGPRSARPFKELAVPDGYRPRGSAAAARTSRSQLDRYDAPTADRRDHQKPLTMPMLRRPNREKPAAQEFITQ
jgi:SRSO17 transposase